MASLGLDLRGRASMRRLTNWLADELSTALFLLVMLVIAAMHPRAAIRDLLSMRGGE